MKMNSRDHSLLVAKSVPSELGPSEAHVWMASIARVDSSLDRDMAVLAEDEVLRASSMARSPRHQFVSSRAILRRLLSSYLAVPAKLISLSYGSRGKPRLSAAHMGEGLHFNLSHSSETAAFVFAGSPVGIDIEGRREFTDLDALARRVLTSGELRALHAVPASQREHAFLQFWTRKESYAKALGGGIAEGLRSFEIMSRPNSKLGVRRVDGTNMSDWSVMDLEVGPALVGALAIQHPDCRLRFRRWPPEARG